MKVKLLGEQRAGFNSLEEGFGKEQPWTSQMAEFVIAAQSYLSYLCNIIIFTARGTKETSLSRQLGGTKEDF